MGNPPVVQRGKAGAGPPSLFEGEGEEQAMAFVASLHTKAIALTQLSITECWIQHRESKEERV